MYSTQKKELCKLVLLPQITFSSATTSLRNIKSTIAVVKQSTQDTLRVTISVPKMFTEILNEIMPEWAPENISCDKYWGQETVNGSKGFGHNENTLFLKILMICLSKMILPSRKQDYLEPHESFTQSIKWIVDAWRPDGSFQTRYKPFFQTLNEQFQAKC